MHTIVQRLKDALDDNDGKIPLTFIDDEVDRGTVIHKQLTPNMRVCIIRLQSGHEVIGVAQVLNVENDVEEIGKTVALGNARNELWKVFGSIALAV